MEHLVGIDLGTTFSVVAYVNPLTGRAEVLPDPDNGERTTPSVVLFDPEKCIVGKFAKDNAIAEPDSVVEYVKREMGKPSEKPPPEGFQREFGGHRYNAQEISAIILKRMKEIAEKRLDSQVTKAVVTVPAYFDERRRAATKEAAEIAGLEVIDILDEPVAAALAYRLDKSDRDQTVFVLDLGGGTFDVTVLKISGGSIIELAIGGDPWLGGKNWDEAIMKHCSQLFMDEFNEDPESDSAAWQELHQRVLRAKHELSDRVKATIIVNYAGHTKQIVLPRETFEMLTTDLVKNCQALSERTIEEAREKAGVTWDSVDTVLLVGGATRMPMIRDLAQRMSGKDPSTALNADECVALGAAWHAVIKRMQADPSFAAEWNEANPQVADTARRTSIRRIIAHDLGATARLGGPTGPLKSFLMLRHGTPLPAKFVDTFETVYDGMEFIEIGVTEDGYYADGRTSDPDECIELGKVRVGPLPPGTRAGWPIEVSYEYGEDGILHVKCAAREDGSVLVESTIDRPGSMSAGDMELARRHLDETAVES
jgi:molecular chaperone DnaK